MAFAALGGFLRGLGNAFRQVTQAVRVHIITPARNLLQGIRTGVNELMPLMQMVLPVMMLIDPDILDQMPLEEFQEYLNAGDCTITYIEDAFDSVGGSKGGAGSVGAFCFDNPLDGYKETWYDDNKFGVNKHLRNMYKMYYGFEPSSAAEKKSARDAMASGDFQKLTKEYVISHYHKKEAKRAPISAPAPAPAPAPKPKSKPKKSKKAPTPMPMEEYSSMYTPEITNQPPVGLGRKMCTCKH